MKKPRRKPEPFMFRIVKGGMQPADGYTVERLRQKGYKTNDLVAVTIKKTRKYWYHKKVHLFCRLVSENIEVFSGIPPHLVLKTLQIEADAYCEYLMIRMPGIGPVSYRTPISVSFDSMDQGEFEEFYKKLCNHVSSKYWPDLDETQVERMAEMMD